MPPTDEMANLPALSIKEMAALSGLSEHTLHEVGAPLSGVDLLFVKGSR